MTTDTDALLMDVLAQVPVHGWTDAALGAADPSGERVRSAWPGGMPDAIDAFAGWADRAMEATLEGTDLDDMKVRKRVRLMVRRRLEALEPHREAVRREALYVAAQRPDLGARLVWRTASRIWYLAGDAATDFNHYSKRGLLCGVIASTTLCWLGDDSDDRQPTWDFLDRRIDNVMELGKALGKAKTFADPSDWMERATEFAGRFRYRG